MEIRPDIARSTPDQRCFFVMVAVISLYQRWVPYLVGVGFVAVVAATSDIVGGFLITDRMLKMFRRDEPKAKTPESK